MKQNKGFTLVELIIVIAIMAIVTGLVSMSMAFVLGLDARQCAQELDGYLKLTKTKALSKNAEELRIYQDAGNKQFYVDFVESSYTGTDVNNPIPTTRTVQTEMIGKSAVAMTYTLSDAGGTIRQIGNGGDSISIGFDRGTGAFKRVKINNVESLYYCAKITITRGSREYVIEMVPETGKHRIQ